jgi:hypothetical protein
MPTQVKVPYAYQAGTQLWSASRSGHLTSVEKPWYLPNKRLGGSQVGHEVSVGTWGGGDLRNTSKKDHTLPSQFPHVFEHNNSNSCPTPLHVSTIIFLLGSCICNSYSYTFNKLLYYFIS